MLWLLQPINNVEKQTSRACQVQISPDSLEPHHKKQNKTKTLLIRFAEQAAASSHM